ncbi:hypothetical protein [Cellulomonas sp. HZM]|uniref:hypothetical protein n=1 Tax=Cellulomonas sp. HZM TaxID=1454010 RepID=UPI000492FCEB|nr:hypothetical protein [Cellulomonas sp. HZM]
MRFHDVPLDQAELFRDHVIAREPYMLRELASWMEQTGGPIELMDASVTSLIRMCDWYLDLARAGFLGLVDDAVPARYPELTLAEQRSHPHAVARRLSAAAGDRLVHYVRLVWGRLVPESYWGVYTERRRPFAENLRHQTVVFLPGWHWPDRKDIDWSVFVQDSAGIGFGAMTGAAGESDRLAWSVASSCPRDLRPWQQSRESSVLTGYLEADLPPMPEIARVTPALAWVSAPVEPEVRAAGDGEWDEMVLAKGPVGGLEEPGLLVPLPVDAVVGALRAAGFVGVDARGVLAEGEFEHAEGVAHVMTLVHGGELRAVHVEPVSPSESSWEAVLAPLRMLAVDLGANFGPAGDYPA